MDISVKVLEPFLKNGAQLSDLHLFQLANCIVAGVEGHETCGWCPHCNAPVAICGHPRTPNALLEDLSKEEINIMWSARDWQLLEAYRRGPG